MKSSLNEAFGYGGGWHVERRTSKKAKARERATLFYQERVGRREREAKVAAVWECLGCGAELVDDPHQRGPRKSWCSAKCYARERARNRRSGTRVSDGARSDKRRGEFACAHCQRKFTWKAAHAGHEKVCVCDQRDRRDSSI